MLPNTPLKTSLLITLFFLSLFHETAFADKNETCIAGKGKVCQQPSSNGGSNNPNAYRINGPTSLNVPNTSVLTTSGGFGGGNDSYTSSTPLVCDFASSPSPSPSGEVRTKTPGTCTIVATKAARGGYGSVTAQISFTVYPAPPVEQTTPVTLTSSASSIYHGETVTLNISGGNGSGLYNLDATCPLTATNNPNQATLSGNNTGASATTCTVTATRAASEGYLASNPSSPVTVTINPLQAQTLTVTAASNSIYTSGTTTLSTTGHQGAVTYAASGSCAVSGSTVTAGSAAGSCIITATAAATPGYSAGSSQPITITVALQAQTQTLTVTSDVGTIYRRSGCNISETATLSTSGNRCANPSIVYSTTTPTCSVNGNLVTASSTGSPCVISATQAACSGSDNTSYMASTATLSIPVQYYGTPNATVSSNPMRGTAANKASATVTITNALRPYYISCASSDYRSNCSMIANDGTSETTGTKACPTCAYNSPEIYGGMSNTFQVKSWVAVNLAANSFGGQVTFKVRDACVGTYGASTQSYTPQ